MFPRISSPQGEIAENAIRLEKEIFPNRSDGGELVRWLNIALTHDSCAGVDAVKRQAPRSCLQRVGQAYAKLLIGHFTMASQPTVSVETLVRSMSGSPTMLDAAEMHLRLLERVIMPDHARKDFTTQGASTSLQRELHQSVIGAAAICLSYAELKVFFDKHYLAQPLSATAGISFKTVLQEFSHGLRKGQPAYTVVGETGPKHGRQFEVRVDIFPRYSAVGTGTSKKQAEEAAAEALLVRDASAFLRQYLNKGKATRTGTPGGIEAVDHSFDPLFANLGVTQSQRHLFQRALTHASYRALGPCGDNHVLAVFGDAVLHAGLAHFVVEKTLAGEATSLGAAHLATIIARAREAEALASVAEDMCLPEFVRCDPRIFTQKTSTSIQRRSVLDAVIGAKFLAAAPSIDLERVLGPELLAHFTEVWNAANQGTNIDDPMVTLHRFVGLHRVGMVAAGGTHEGPRHARTWHARIEFRVDENGERLTVSGGKGSSIASARKSLAIDFLPLLEAVHEDLSAGGFFQRNQSAGRAASFFLRAALPNAPHGKEAIHWQMLGLLGTRHLSAGDFAAFSKWSTRALKILADGGIAESQVVKYLMPFYAAIDVGKDWDFRTKASGIIKRLQLELSSENSLEKVATLRTQKMFMDLQQLLRVLSIAPKSGRTTTTIMETLDALSVLNRTKSTEWLLFTGPAFAIAEREGSLVELFRELLDILGVSLQVPNTVQIHTREGIEDFHLSVRCENSDRSKSDLKSALRESLILEFLKADGLLSTIQAEEKQISVFGRKMKCSPTFVERVREIIVSPVSKFSIEALLASGKALHDLKNHLVAAETSLLRPKPNRTEALRAQAEASAHLDSANRLAEQFHLVAGALLRPEIEKIELRAFFRGYCASLLNRLPPNVILVIPKNVEEHCLWSCGQFLESIVENLVKNSIEALPSGGSIELSWAFSSPDNSATILIKDTGCGIDASRLSLLLSGKPVASSKISGNGIGMLTVLAMLRRIGGTITGQSEMGEGTEWQILLPSLAPLHSHSTLMIKTDDAITIEAK